MASQPEHSLRRLKSGRHGLTREEVIASQRGRLLEAMVQSVAAKGYATVTVADVVERAEVSRRTFYEQFTDKQQCLIEAFDVGVDVMLGRMRRALEAVGDDADWRERARVAVATYLEVLTEEPEFAWALHVEMFGAGAEPLARRAEVVTLFAEVWRHLRDRAVQLDPSLPAVPPAAYRVLTAGIEELIREHIRTRGAQTLEELLDPALDVAFAMLIGHGR